MKLFCLSFAIIVVINVCVPSFAQETETQHDYIVKLFYFRPNDREVQPDIYTRIDGIIKKSQQFYANEMERQGFGRKTFRFETNQSGNAVVHHIMGKHGHESYAKNPAKAFREIDKSLYKYNRNIIVVIIDTSKKVLLKNALGLTYSGKRIAIPSGKAFNVGVTVHELGHTFGLPHGVGGLKGMSKYAAIWLDVNRYFNPDRVEGIKDSEAQVKMSSSIAYPPNNQNIFFEIADQDGLRMARFLTGATVLHSGASLSGKDGIATFTTFGETLPKNRVKITTMDVNGGGTWGKWLSLDEVAPKIILDVSVEATDIQNGLIGYWPLDEAIGPYAFNTISKAHHAKLKEGVILQHNIGKIGGALETKWKHGATVENGAELINRLQAFTAALWVKSDGVGSDRGFISSRMPKKKDDTFSIRYDAQGNKGSGFNVIKATIRTTNGIQTYESTSNVQTGEWQHIALTWQSGQKLKLYINGVLDQPTFNSPAKHGKVIGADRLVIGKGNHDNHTSWRGMVDDVHLYNRVLDAKEIANLPHVNQTDKHFHGVSIAAVADLSDGIIMSDADVKYIITVTNTGNIHDTINLAISGDIDATLSHASVSLASGESSEVSLTIPNTVFDNVGEYVAKVTATSENDIAKTAKIITNTTIKPGYFR